MRKLIKFMLPIAAGILAFSLLVKLQVLLWSLIT